MKFLKRLRKGIWKNFGDKFLSLKIKALIKQQNEGKVITMCTVVERFMDEGRVEGIKEGIKGMVGTCEEFGVSKEETIERIQCCFSLSDSEAMEYVELYWK